MPPRARLLLPLVVLAAVGGAAVWFHARDGAGQGGGALTLYGDVDIREVQPAFNDSGHIVRMLVQEGAEVKRGQLLATLDATRYAAALAQARGQLRADQQALAKLRAGSRPEEIADARARMDALAVTYRNDAANYRRAVALARTAAGTIQNRDNARAAYDAARAQYEAARQAWILAVKGPRAEDIAAAAATVAAARGAVALARREWQDTRLRAPADGVVEDRILEPGDMAAPATPVFTIALPSPLWVRAYVSEDALGKVPLGAPATVTTDSAPGRVYRGWIGYLSPVAEFTPKTVETPALRTALVYQLRVYVCDGNGDLRLGMPATVRISPGARPTRAPPGCGPVDAGAR